MWQLVNFGLPLSPAVTSEEVEGWMEGREWNADCRPQSLTCYISHRQIVDRLVFCARKVAVVLSDKMPHRVGFVNCF